jgi:dTDP-4-amino-4,6-dideoxygalactose transaminase
MPEPQGSHSTRWLTCLTLEGGGGSGARDLLLKALGRHSIEARPVWKPMHLQPVFAGARALVTGAAQALFDNGLVLPSGSALDEPQISRVFEAIDGYLERRP